MLNIPIGARSLLPYLPWVALALWLSWLRALRRVPWVALAYGLGTLAIASFQHYRYAGFVRHYGHYFVLLVACVWLYEKMRPSGPPNWLLRGLLTVTFAAQVAAGIEAIKAEIQFPFSGSVQASSFLRSAGLADAPMVGSFDHAASVVAGYLDRPFRSAETDESITFVTFHDRRRLSMPMSEVIDIGIAEAKRAGKPAILILNRDLGTEPPAGATVEKLFDTGRPLIADEQFRIVRITPSEVSDRRDEAPNGGNSQIPDR
jgi:hypothetical protein